MRSKIEARLALLREQRESVMWKDRLDLRIGELEWVLEQMPKRFIGRTGDLKLTQGEE